MTDTDYAALAREHGLKRVGARPPLHHYIRETWQRRAFAFTLARYRLEARNGQNRLGLAWVVLRPLINAAVYGVVFGLILARDSRPANFIPFLVVGVFIFEFFSKSLSEGAKSIANNAQLVRSLSFPRVLLPISIVIQQILELVPMVVVMLIIVLVFGEPITLNWLLLVPVLAIMALFNFGVAFIAARLTVHLRDLTQILPFVTRIMFYSTGIFYSIDKVLKDSPLLLVAQLNPVHDFIALVRFSVVSGTVIQPWFWLVIVASSLVFAVGGFIFFWLAEEQYGRD